MQRVAEELGVQYVLEGSIQRTGDEVRLTAQLIDALSGRHIWAERFDRPIDDIMSFRDAVVKQIVTALRVELVGGEFGRVEAQTLPIRLTPMTATCRVPPLSRVKLGIGWSRGVARDAEQ